MADAAYWDAQAATFDEAPDHGLREPEVREAWARLLLPHVLPTSTIADLGCGTGSLSVLLAAHGHHVCGVDVAPRMVAAAREKARQAGVTAEFVVGDAAAPPWHSGSRAAGGQVAGCRLPRSASWCCDTVQRPPSSI